MAYKAVKGSTDLYPEDMDVRNKVFGLIRQVVNSFGFKEIDSPVFENLGLLTAKSGEEIKTQIFTLEKKGKEELGLRFDLTIPYTRLFIEKQKTIPKPVKWFGLSRMWRYERPQAGRLREFYQLSVEMFGSDKPEADAEIITMAIEALKSFGLTNKDFYVRLNNRKLLQGIISNYIGDKKVEEVIRVIDKKEKVSEKDFLEMLTEVGVKNADDLLKTLDLETLEEVESLELNEEAREGLEELKAIAELIDMNYVKLSLSTARGLAYYTSTVFEVFDKVGKFRSIAGGGRYNNLVSLLGGQECPATGFAIGYSTLSLLLKEKGLLPKADLSVEYYIAPISDNEKAKAIEVANKLRKKYSVEVDLMGRKLKKQFDYANNINAKKVIIIGEQEVNSNKLKVKDMKSGEEKEVDIDILLKKP